MTADHDEWVAAVADLTEAEREDNCSHTGMRRCCPDCGFHAEPDYIGREG